MKRNIHQETPLQKNLHLYTFLMGKQSCNLSFYCKSKENPNYLMLIIKLVTLRTCLLMNLFIFLLIIQKKSKYIALKVIEVI